MAAERFIFRMEGLSRKHGEKYVLKDVSLSFYHGAKIGVLGRNGAGKSSLLRIMAGEDTEFEGTAELLKDFTVGYLSQEPQLDPEKDVLGNVMDAVAPIQALLDRYDAVNEKLGEPLSDDEMNQLLEEQAELQEKIEACDAWELDRRVEIAMDAMRLPPGDADVTSLSGGERRRVALCKILLERPDLLLLDEPTNHLDAESIDWLERHLAEYPGSVVAVTHDRYFLDNAAEWILELDRGRGIPYKGNYAAWLEQKKSRLLLEEKRETTRQKTLERELKWIQMTPPARMKRNKARVQAFEKLEAEAAEANNDDFEMQIPSGPHLGDMVIEAEGLSKSFGDNLLFEDVSFRIPPGAIVGVLGPNGAGKTTLFRMIIGEETPDSGTLRIGETVKLGYVDQSRDSLNSSKSIWEEISNDQEFFEIGNRRINTRAYVSQFNFRGTEQQKKVGILSGGERNRVQLAKLLRDGNNVVLFDEPTNDLDVDTLRSLEEAILNFPGCAIVVSHDRWFLDRIATHILAFEGDSYVHWCEGNYQTYHEQRLERLGKDADQPHRIKYKKLTR
ncbi:putative ABC transporter ATP-binding protein [Planctomycetes bacterium Pan216]|uniref:Energy-dependent translational throttle protein EttA n=1 Tax=Kolteria novifilia TaxID=2527975 RepID=A0A518AX62_9BACT|nr:putative ABC transporter ATP-binding protein [Planctomycetes bacterium Pan216]